MTIINTISQFLAAALSVGTIGGLLLHDTNIDKAALKAVSSEFRVAAPGSMPHTHSERGSLHQAIRDLNASQPRTQPRNQSDRRYIQAKPSARGHHPFDNYTLPVIS